MDKIIETYVLWFVLKNRVLIEANISSCMLIVLLVRWSQNKIRTLRFIRHHQIDTVVSWLYPHLNECLFYGLCSVSQIPSTTIIEIVILIFISNVVLI